MLCTHFQHEKSVTFSIDQAVECGHTTDWSKISDSAIIQNLMRIIAKYEIVIQEKGQYFLQ